jgi:hypothetical protein
VAVTPPVRSSDLGLVLTDPFKYYLVRRLGLVPMLSYSEALSVGSWFHTAMQCWPKPGAVSEAKPRFEEKLNARCTELEAACAVRGIIADSRDRILNREKQDAWTAWAWTEALFQIPEFVNSFWSADYQMLDQEVLIRSSLPGTTGVDGVAQLDAVLLRRPDSTLWIVDYKTTSHDAIQRAQTCPMEFQTWHYLSTLTRALHESGDFLRHWNLPSHVRVGGMLHVCVQKPPIRFGESDRDYRLEPKTLKSGPRKGQTILEKHYVGDPKPENYIRRVKDWVLGRGDYEHLAPERQNPEKAVWCISNTSCQYLEQDHIQSSYRQALDRILECARRTPEPGHFMRTSRGMTAHDGSLSPYAPFYVHDPVVWPSIVEQEGFMVARRDVSPSDSPSDTQAPASGA